LSYYRKAGDKPLSIPMQKKSKKTIKSELSCQEQIGKLKDTIKDLKRKEKMRTCQSMNDRDAILAHIADCIGSPLHSQLQASGHDDSMSMIIAALNKLAEENNSRFIKNYKDMMMRIKLLSKYQSYYEEALYESTGLRITGFKPIKYADFYYLPVAGKEAWPLSCYLN
jgi:hypothetical protein